MPNDDHVKPDWSGIDKPIFSQGKLMDYSAIGTGEQLKLPLPVIEEIVDPHIRYEESTKSVIITTSSKLLHIQKDQKRGTLNQQPYQLRFAPEEVGGVLYIPIRPLEDIYGISVHEDQDTGVILLMKVGETIQWSHIKESGKKNKTAAMRTDATIHAPILQDVVQGSKLRIWDEQDHWYYAQTDNGFTGYVHKDEVVLDDTQKVNPPEEQAPSSPKDWKGKKVNLTWEAVYEKNPSTESIGSLPGVNVVSPTWFRIVDGNGNVRSQADISYVEWAHNRHMEVWALLNNGFNPDLTSSALSTFETRQTIITQMLHYAKIYDLDGINIDFENVYSKDGDNVTQLVRELRPLAHEQGLVISIDVTPKSSSELWSLFLDRQDLGELIDYMIVMAYDEHWASSPKAGSVSSLPWAEKAVTRILNEDGVPADKLILGIPLYTRIWSETIKDGKTEVSSKAVGMETVQETIQKLKLKTIFSEDTGQNVAEYQEDGVDKKIWIEDKVSLEARVKLAKSLGLAGIATWNRSFASEESWDILKQISE
ncbi:glycosyl hydrolase family 18 protein [Paenibacillus sediminis]|nr:glycosyl hydrolase family 18 protein [Paenibacillus sediminis]